MRLGRGATLIVCTLAIVSGCHAGAAAQPATPSTATVAITTPSTSSQVAITTPSTSSQVAPTTPSTSSQVAPTFSRLDCNTIGDDNPPAGYFSVLDSVSLPDPARTPALGASRDPDPAAPRLTYFAKTGLGIRVGKQWRITVPEQAASHLLIGWGSPGTPSTSVGPPPATCQLPPSTTGWLWFPGGFWTDRPGCYPLLVDTGGRRQQISVGIGEPCPGQSPPQ